MITGFSPKGRRGNRAFGFCTVLTLLVLWFGAATAQTLEPRIALIVGNEAYSAVSPLDNPVSDAELMAQTLESQGFTVTLLTDADQIGLNRAIAQFGRDLREAGQEATGLFYYAGHAVQSFGSNFLLPVDAALTDAADLSLVAVPAQAVLRQMFSAKNKTNIVIFDACRNNPFSAIPDLNDNGLAEMKSPTGTFLSYSTAPGAVALDGLEGNSPFTKALAAQIPVPGVPIEQVFKNVRIEVIEKTNGQQTPWDTSSLTGDFVFAAAPLNVQADLSEAERWAAIRDSTDPVPVVVFMRDYPEGVHMAEARALLDKIINAELGPNTANTQTLAPIKTPVPAAQPEDPSAEQQRLIGIAQASGKAEDYQAYLLAFPQGTYAELAAFELKILEEKSARPAAAGTGEGQTALVATAEPARTANAPMGSELTFTMPFTNAEGPLIGKSFSELIEMSALYAPIDGLPDALWKDQSCSNCHQWTKEALCTQGKTYVRSGGENAVSKKHPFGGVFKKNLRSWAEGGCK
jgi:hypothetical protein